MPTSEVWGNTVGSGSNARVYLTYDRIDHDGVNGWLVNPKIHWAMNSGWSDSNNYVDSGGSAINGARVHSGLLNSSRSWDVSAKAVPLAYGTTTNYTFTVTVYGVSYFRGDSNTSTFTWTIAFPKRPYSLPNPATNFTNTYVNETRVDLSWTPNYTGGNGATPWSNQYIDRTETGEWSDAVQVAALGWEPTSWTDTTLQLNKRYTYRHRATNPAGSSPYAYAAGAIYTKPAAPTAVTAAKQTDGSIQVTFTNKAPWATVFEISDSANGTNWTVLTSTHAGGTYTHTSPNASVTHRYQMRAKTPDGKWSDYSTVSNIVQLQAPPNAPTWLAWVGSVDAREPVTVTWSHNPVDTMAQSAYEIQWRSSTNGGSTWSAWTATGKVTSTTSSRTFAANTFPQTALIDRQVRTWGAHATASAWSASGIFQTSARPMAGIAYPTSGATVASKGITVTWTYADTEGLAQSAWRVVLKTGAGDCIDQWSESNANKSFAIPHDLADATSYIVEVTVRDGASVWSLPTEVTFSVAYVPPPAPTVTAEWDSTRGAGVLTIVNLAPSGGEPAAVSNNIYRDGLLIATGYPVNTAFVDPLPSTSGSTYAVEAVSALPSSVSSVPASLPHNEEVYRRFWLNAGPGWGTVASFYGNVKRRRSTGIAKTVEHYSGRELPVETFGEAVTDALSFSATLYDLEDSPEDFHAISKIKSTVCLREPKGRWFVSVSPVDASSDNHLTSEISVEFKRVDFEEGVS